MKWKDILSKRYHTGLSLFIVLVMMTLLVFYHKKNLSELHGSLSSIYMDRLVAESHLYNLSHQYYEKKILVGAFEPDLYQQQINTNDAIQQLIQSYEKTYLTDEESTQWTGLKKDIRIALQFEQHFLYPESPIDQVMLTQTLLSRYDDILNQLNTLTDIQLKEGQKLLMESDHILASNIQTTRLAVGLILVLCMLVFLLYTSPQIKPNQGFYEKLNQPKFQKS
ncbi:MAG: MCP four helix bundle domain-containing protein [Marinoscillum sp.]